MDTDPQNSRKGTIGVTSDGDNPDKGLNGATSTETWGKGTNGVTSTAGKVNNGGDAVSERNLGLISASGPLDKCRVGGPPRVPPPNAA